MVKYFADIYNSTTTIDDGSCEYPDETYLNCNNNCLNDIDDDDITNTETSIPWGWVTGGGVQMRGNIPYLEPQFPLGTSIPNFPDLDPASITMIGSARNSSVRGFGANHPAGANFALADGSVRNIPRSTDSVTLYELGGKADGGVPLNF